MKYQYCIGITILIPIGRFFDTIIDIHAHTYKYRTNIDAVSFGELTNVHGMLTFLNKLEHHLQINFMLGANKVKRATKDVISALKNGCG